MSPMIIRINAIYRLEAIRRIVWYALVLSVIVGGYLWSMTEEPENMAGHVDRNQPAQATRFQPAWIAGNLYC